MQQTLNRLNHHPDEVLPSVDAEEELALEFFAEFRAFERALKKAGFTKRGCLHQQGLPDWEGFARHIEPRFDPHRSPILLPAVTYLLGISVKRLDDRDSSRTYPADRRFYQSDILWLSMVIRAAGHRMSYGLPFLSRGDCDDVIRGAALLVLKAWAEYMDGTGSSTPAGQA
jgi:hypothetical protein